MARSNPTCHSQRPASIVMHNEEVIILPIFIIADLILVRVSFVSIINTVIQVAIVKDQIIIVNIITLNAIAIAQKHSVVVCLISVVAVVTGHGGVMRAALIALL